MTMSEDEKKEPEKTEPVVDSQSAPVADSRPTNLIMVDVHVTRELAIKSGYNRIGIVHVPLDLNTITPEQQGLLLNWAELVGSALSGITVRSVKAEWTSEDNARRGVKRHAAIVATKLPPTLDDVWDALKARRDREPQEMEFEKIAEERRAKAEKEAEPKCGTSSSRFDLPNLMLYVVVILLSLGAGITLGGRLARSDDRAPVKPAPCVCESKDCAAVPPCSQIDCPSCPDPTTVRVPLSDELARIWDSCAPGVETAESAYNNMLVMELSPLFMRAEALGIKFNSFEWIKNDEARDVASEIIAARDHFFELRNNVFAVAHDCRRKMEAFVDGNESQKKVEAIEERLVNLGSPSLDYFYEFFTYEVFDQVQCNLATGMLRCSSVESPPAEAPSTE